MLHTVWRTCRFLLIPFARVIASAWDVPTCFPPLGVYSNVTVKRKSSEPITPSISLYLVPLTCFIFIHRICPFLTYMHMCVCGCVFTLPLYLKGEFHGARDLFCPQIYFLHVAVTWSLYMEWINTLMSSVKHTIWGRDSLINGRKSLPTSHMKED